MAPCARGVPGVSSRLKPLPPDSDRSSSPGDTSAYWELDAELNPDAEELWGMLCYEHGALGAEMLQDTGPSRLVRHFFGVQPDVEVLQAAFTHDYPGAPAPLRVTVQRQAVQPWETAWRAHFTPLRLGRRLLVTPPWEQAGGDAAAAPAPDADLLRIVIDPGQGFGTGWHASTALALETLEAALEGRPAPARLLDVGTGSGILSIAGRLLGVGAAVAIDIDAQALPEVRRNAALSGIHPVPAVARSKPDCLRGTFPLVLANIVSEVLLQHRHELARLTAPGGYLILSGILAQEREAVAAAYAALGLHPALERQREGWIALCLRRD